MAPTQFHVSLLTRSKQITYENLRLRDAGVVEEATEWWNRDQAKRLGIATAGRPAWIDAPPMFAPFRLREMWVPNRVAVSPMAQYSAVDGVPGDWHLVHYGSRALGGAGLVFVEMTCVSPEGRITPGCTGLWNDEQAQAFARIVDFVHANTQSKICMQIGHAGRKGSTQVGWGGGLADRRVERPAQLAAAVAVAAAKRDGVNQVPREMTREDMDEVIEQFADRRSSPTAPVSC